MDGNLPLPAITTTQMVEVDRLMIEVYGIQLIQMMENAGRNLAELARRILGGRVVNRTIVVLCGTGNNGGGGMVAARHLHNWGADVRVKLVGDQEDLKEIPAHQWQTLQAIGLVSEADPALEKADLILDALIGYGLSRDPRPVMAGWIDLANAANRLLLALDAPSGLDTTSGIPGMPCIRATATLTLALPKTGLLSPQAKPFVGDLYLADIGVPPELYCRLGLDIPQFFSEDMVVKIP